ncbi:MAG: hypothetical protein Q4G13_08360, partial [Moraxella sp.]|nr:hypothetical protein [Moraxella sp.]
DKTANDKHALADNSTSPSIQQPATQSAAKPAPATTKTAQPVKTSEPASATPAATPSAQPAQTTNTNSNTKAAAPQDNTPTKTPASKAVPKAAAASTTQQQIIQLPTIHPQTPSSLQRWIFLIACYKSSMKKYSIKNKPPYHLGLNLWV